MVTSTGAGPCFQCTFEERPCGCAVTALGHQHVDDLTVLVDSAIQVYPAARDLDVGVGSGRGAVSVFRLIRFLGPPAEPDVPVPEHPALHKSVPLVMPRWLVLSTGEGSWHPGSGNG